MQSWSVTRLRATAALVCMCVAFGGCATVAVVEPATAVEIALLESRSGLYKAANDFCESSRARGLATGQASLTGIADVILGNSTDGGAYARTIRASEDSPADVIRRIRADAAGLSEDLSELNVMARALTGSGHVTREDVSSFESVLIHARQGRNSLSEALAVVNGRVRTGGYDAGEELDSLDKALQRARGVADDLAAAKTEVMPARAPVAVSGAVTGGRLRG